MKILYIITGLAQGGAERVVCDLADAMFRKGHEVKIAYLTGEVLTRPSNTKIELIKVNLNNMRLLIPAYIKFKKIIREYQPDVVHSHMVHANLFSRLVRITVPMKKLISTAHNSNEGGRGRMFLYRATHNLSELTTNVSNTAVTSFELKNAVPNNSMKTVYNGVDFNKFNYYSLAKKELCDELKLDENCKIILSVGRFNKQKNYPNLLKAIEILKREVDYSFKLIIAGDGELRPLLESMIKEKGLEHDVILLGRRHDVPTLMSACDVFVLSSDYEGLPTVLIEAIACQAQVVSTEVSGAREIIGDYGYIVPTKDSAKLSTVIITALNLKERNVLGKNYSKNKFDINIISKKWLDIYNEE
tara:strand:- start:3819 stop:4895 length:1077 start_codon:yes stop_codon:yes gene_type:complete